MIPSLFALIIGKRCRLKVTGPAFKTHTLTNR